MTELELIDKVKELFSHSSLVHICSYVFTIAILLKYGVTLFIKLLKESVITKEYFNDRFLAKRKNLLTDLESSHLSDEQEAFFKEQFNYETFKNNTGIWDQRFHKPTLQYLSQNDAKYTCHEIRRVQEFLRVNSRGEFYIEIKGGDKFEYVMNLICVITLLTISAIFILIAAIPGLEYSFISSMVMSALFFLWVSYKFLAIPISKYNLASKVQEDFKENAPSHDEQGGNNTRQVEASISSECD